MSLCDQKSISIKRYTTKHLFNVSLSARFHLKQSFVLQGLCLARLNRLDSFQCRVCLVLQTSPIFERNVEQIYKVRTKLKIVPFLVTAHQLLTGLHFVSRAAHYLLVWGNNLKELKQFVMRKWLEADLLCCISRYAPVFPPFYFFSLRDIKHDICF